ncbi:leucine-rich repeat domain-containing protein [Aureibacter tunicatorum]|uniref:Leucine-rich repeat (LRR) protein n=1 Tax=Aureibacter tunicatorum TaxID=866807 RepID=A0AAE4BQ46_9BACT|nr:leucine-rich repeat domain-containing protein [Aureibacter tunicatorum]MDR6237176.1 Leucine-rich repeat (LRR) protein [Aureibacter tunicatorum]BDD06168.1 hypothetical protein AUTU_36510 [Aureibacter tunicatorum]
MFNNKLQIFLATCLFFAVSSCSEFLKQIEIPETNPTVGTNTGIQATNQENQIIQSVISSETVKSDLMIFVKDTEGQSLSEATINISDENFTTDINGFILLENIEVNKDFVAVKASKENYVEAIKTVRTSDSGLSTVYLYLKDAPEAKVFTASEGATVEYEEITLVFPENAIADQDGNRYEGNVNTSITYYDPTAEDFEETMPGILVGIDEDENIVGLISRGMIKVDLRDDEGNELEIFEGEEVEIRMPAGDNAPQTIPLWHLNEKHGLWMETATATLQGDEYVVNVKHFSTYNLDFKIEDSIEPTIIIKDQDGNLIKNQEIEVKVNSDQGNASKNIATDENAEFKLINAPKGDYTFELETICGEIKSASVALDETKTYEVTIDLSSEQSIVNLNLSGNLKQCEENYSNKAFAISFDLNGSKKYLGGYTNAEGEFEIQKVLCDMSEGDYPAKVIIIDDEVQLSQDFTITISETNKTYDFNLCEGSIGTEIIDELDDNFIIIFDDEILQINIIYELGLEPNTTITYGHIKDIDSLYIGLGDGKNGVESINGMEYFTNLTYLEIFGGTFSDISPLAALSQLEELDLGHNLISDISNLTSLNNLKVLNLSSCYNLDLSTISNLNGLTKLDISRNYHLNNISPLANLVNLVELNMESCDKTDLSGLANLVNLKVLNLGGKTDRNDISVLANLTNLTKLDLSGHYDLSNFSPLADLTNLTDLSLNNNSQLNDITLLANLTNLTKLSLRNNGQLIDISPLINLTNLTKLSIDNNDQLTDISLLANLTNLTDLSLSNNGQLIDISPLANLTNLTTLFLGGNHQLTDISPLKNLNQLEYLYLRYTGFTREQVDELKQTIPNCHITF